MPRTLFRALLPYLLFLAAASALATDFYVSPSGHAAGTGSLGNPWDLKTALKQPNSVKPGDTIWLRGGTYNGFFTSSLSGTALDPIQVRQYPGERATIDGGNSNGETILSVGGRYTWYWGFEVMSSDVTRVSTQIGAWPTDIGRGEGVGMVQIPGSGVGVKFINLVVHDARIGFSFWKEATDSEIYGCIIYNNGWMGPDRGHGHGIYTQNQTGTKSISSNVISNNYDYGIQLYGSSSTFLNNYVLDSNISFNNGSAGGKLSGNIYVGGGAPTNNIQITNNRIYMHPYNETSICLVGSSNSRDVTLSQNYIVGFLSLLSWPTVHVIGNNFVGTTTLLEYEPRAGGTVTWDYNIYRSQESAWQPFNLLTTPIRGLFFPAWRLLGFDANSTYVHDGPRGIAVFVDKNRYEAGRANIAVYNYQMLPSVTADVSSVLAPGAKWQLLKGNDYYGAPVASGTYDGNPITIPMAGIGASRPIGGTTPATTAPEFNAYILVTVP